MTQLKELWTELLKKYVESEERIEAYWTEIVEHYNSPDRHYHSLAHLEYLVQCYLHHHQKIEDKDAFLFAIYYHDIIYDVTRSDNEERSAEMAESRLTELNVPESRIDRCVQHILATKDHSSTKDQDTNLLMDCDLKVLGESQELFDTYSTQIRAEYSHLSDTEYIESRKEYFSDLLQHDQIYSTSDFREALEGKAIQNIKRLMAVEVT